MSPSASLQSSKIAAFPSAAREETELVQHTRALVELSTPRSLDISAVGGWHGTSKEALELARHRGGLPGSAIEHAGAAAGNLFFYKPEAHDFASGIDLSLQSLGRGGAEGYATLAGQSSRLMQALGLSYDNPNHHLLTMELRDLLQEDPRKGRRALLKLGLPREELSKLLDGFWEHRGFLVAISRTALERYQVTDGDNPGEDYKIFLPQVLKFQEIAAIIPLGTHEQRWVKELRGMILLPDRFAGLA